MMDQNRPVRVRFAPSPTGHLHLGGARTALYDYLIAQQTGGQFILRIEDTDQKRLVQGAEEELMEGLRWLGIHWDEGPDVGGPYGPYRQSERKAIYRKYALQLIDQDQAFYCFCTADHLEQVRQEQQKRKENPHYDGTCRHLDKAQAAARVAAGEKHVIRFKTPKEGTTTVHDLLRGPITVENRMVDDMILVKSDGLALYHLAAMVDDHEMKITHVIRGSEWLPSFTLHKMIIDAFGWEEPTWVHLSIFLKPSGKGKMSKRETADLVKDGYSIFVRDLEELGYLPEAVVNWISLMGWSYDDHTEFFSLAELVPMFSLERLNPAPAAINFTKFDYFNGLHIRSLSPEDLAGRVRPFFVKAGLEVNEQKLQKIAPIIQERIGTLDEAVEMAGFFFREKVSPEAAELVAKGLTATQSLEIARKCLEIVNLADEISHEKIEAPLRDYVEQTDFSAGQVFGILRVAVTGQKVSPPLFESMEIIGLNVVKIRIEQAIEMLEKLTSP